MTSSRDAFTKIVIFVKSCEIFEVINKIQKNRTPAIILASNKFEALLQQSYSISFKVAHHLNNLN